MWYSLLADLILLLHLGFVFFVLMGGLLTFRWPRIKWLHLPAVAWGAIIEFTGWICPLTPLETWLRTQAGESGYGGDFILRYFLPLLYPESLTREVQMVLGASVLAVNVSIYGWLWQHKRRSRAG